MGHLRLDKAMLADRAYDAGYVQAQIQWAGAMAMIPGEKSCIVPTAHDADLYKEYSHIERIINGLKRLRAVATRLK